MRNPFPLLEGIALIFLYVLAFPAYANIQRLEDAFSPNQGATALVIKTIGTAKKSIHVAAYSFTSRPIADALVAAHDKGVDVEVVLDKSQRRGRNTLVPFLREHHIPTRINSHYAIMHDKTMIIDGETLELGSFNYTNAAEEKNAENVLVIHDNKKIIQDYERQWQILWNQGKE